MAQEGEEVRRIRPRNSLIVAASAIASALLVSPASGKVLKWNCAYPIVSNPNGVVRDQTFDLTFTVDDITGKALVAGTSGVSNVEMFAGNGGFTFLERLVSGAVQTTTIDATGRSVHSRHTMLSGQLVPSQSYGKCFGELR